MPSQKSLKSVCLEVIVFVCMFALLGHLSMNFWESFIIQTELSNMKISLHYLKNTINKIGFAYDSLHRELSGIAEKTDKQQPVASSLAVLVKKEAETQHQQCKELQSLDKRTLHDRHVQARVKARNCTTLTIPVLQDKSAQLYIQDKRRPIPRHIVGTKKGKSGKSVSTITRYPLKSTGTEKPHITCDDEECCNKDYGTKSFNQIHNHRCCKDHTRYNAYENWKF